MTELRHELWLGARLERHGVSVFAGDTTVEQRRDRVRAAILEHGLETVIAGSRDRKPETYAQVFERLYGEPLTGTKRKSSVHKNRAAHSAPTQHTLGESP